MGDRDIEREEGGAEKDRDREKGELLFRGP